MLWDKDSCFAQNMFYSHSANTIKASPTLAVAAQAKKMQLDGLDVIDMSIGEPDFCTPQNICDAAIHAISTGHNKYTEVGGTRALKQAIAYRILNDYKVEFGVESIMASSGAKHSIFNILAATLNPEDEVVIPKPYWVSYPDMVAINGGKSVFCEYHTADFSIDLGSLEKAITKDTKWLIINCPSNPSGAVYTAPTLRAIADILLKNPHVNIISDDVYNALVYDTEFLNIAQIEPRLWPRMIIVGAVSKTYAMTGWRLGYAVGHPTLIKKMTTLQSQMTSCPSSISQAAACEALTGNQDAVREFSKVFKQRRDIAIKILSQTTKLRVARPDGAFYLLPSCAEVITRAKLDGDIGFANILLEKYLVSTVPGSAFGAKDHIRISYAMSDGDLIKGCERIVKACNDLCS